MASKAQLSPVFSDEALVYRFVETGDNGCFEALFARHRKKVFFACRGFFSDSEAAEDATQETFLRVYRNMHRFHEGDFSKWLMRIAKNVCIDLWRKRRPEMALGDDLAEIPASAGSDLSSGLHLIVERLRREMQRLSPDQLRCLEMKIEGYSYEEIALRTGFSAEAVKSHLQNGRRMLWIKMGESVSQLR